MIGANFNEMDDIFQKGVLGKDFLSDLDEIRNQTNGKYATTGASLKEFEK